MKKLLIIFGALFFSGFVGAQSFQEAYQATREIQPYANANGTQSYNAFTGNANEWSKVMGVFYEFDDIQLAKKGIDGSVFLYNTWDNKGAVYLNEKIFKLNNINYHIDKASFMTKIENDSIFIFDFDLVDKIVVNNKTFKRYYHVKEGAHKVFEIIHQEKDFALLKHYSLELIQGSPNPMLGRPRSKIKQNSKYYIEKKGVIQDFKFKKSTLLSLYDGERASALKEYADKYDLSFKKEDDIRRMLKAVK